MRYINREGFTIVELIAVIVVLLILTSFITPNLLKMSNKRKQDVYDNKIKYLESGATSWGNKHLDTLQKNACTCVKVESLVTEGYATGDDRSRGIVTDPRTGESMNDLTICVTYDYEVDKVYSELISDTSTCVTTYGE